MKLIKFIMVTSLIFILGDVFAQQELTYIKHIPEQESSYIIEHGTRVIGCDKYDPSTLDCIDELHRMCRPATISDDPNDVVVECFCSLRTASSIKSAFSFDWASQTSIDDVSSVARAMCLNSLSLQNETEEDIIDVTYSCTELTICFNWVDRNRNGVYDPGEEKY